MVLLGAPPHRLGEMLTLLHLRQNCIRSDCSDVPIIQALQRGVNLNWISGRIPQKIMSMFFMEGNSGQPPKRLEVSRSSNGEDDEEWSLISEMHSRLEIS
ncbi:uncharacterized protein LOC114302971 isoform X2 [Camellia sinensis]|uniref:uncharacterized protein LOC114302971 isoform X2 n=1 Tax=Camellia sinensis TaxID=4442 RepID=UPI0010369B4E|nr:uncharacterized protein LOC114302971 isoform X2 [Camellia sinensis]XP_028103900.1 uncharacterized protein LOC114302971 isoform X2 [Camellia sinensis]XP_028103901.1 uncharacterized protein LOC114302971 isoform X2 [Camellia sinensis]